MGWFDKKFNKFRKMPKSMMILLIFAKFLFGVGLGAALVAYFNQCDWWAIGFALMIIAILLHIPVVYKVFKKGK